MPRVQIDDQIIELTDEKFAERGYTLEGYVDYASAPDDGAQSSTDAG